MANSWGVRHPRAVVQSPGIKQVLFGFVGLSFAGSTVVFAVGMSRRMMGLRRRNLPMCAPHSSDRLVLTVQQPRRNGLPTSRQGRLDAL
jgi:hypothetical protein